MARAWPADSAPNAARAGFGLGSWFSRRPDDQGADDEERVSFSEVFPDEAPHVVEADPETETNAEAVVEMEAESVPTAPSTSASTEAVLALFGGRSGNAPLVTEEEIRGLIGQGTEAGVFAPTTV